MKSNKVYSSCAKLIMKKSSGHLKLSLIMFLVSITILMSISLLYARQYFQYEKDFLENIAVKTVHVDASFDDNFVRNLNSDDIINIKDQLKDNYNNVTTSVIPVYTCMCVSLNGESVSLFGIDKEQAFFLGLDQMEDNIAYFSKKQSKTIALEICVTKETADGFESGEIKRLLLESAEGVSVNTPILTLQNKYLTPSMKESPICFVNMETFNRVASILLAKDGYDAANYSGTSELVTMAGLYIFIDNLNVISDISTFLSTLDYRVYSPTDAFENFSETVSITFIVFLITSIVLLLMTTINILLSFRAFYRVQQKDMGVLKYIGFNDKEILKMYRKNLGKSFMQITLFSVAFVLLVGMFIFSFSHWIVLSCFVLSLVLFLSAIFVIILKFIISKYINQDLITLIRESKEFE